MTCLSWSALVVWSHIAGSLQDPEEAVRPLLELEIASRKIEFDLMLEFGKWEVACAEKETAWMADRGMSRRDCLREKAKLEFFESRKERILEGLAFDIVDVTAPERNIREVTAKFWGLEVKTGQGPLDFYLDYDSGDRKFRVIQIDAGWKIQYSSAPWNFSELPKDRSLPLPQTTPLLTGEAKAASSGFVRFQQERKWLRSRHEVEMRAESLRQSTKLLKASWDRDAAAQLLRRTENCVSLFRKCAAELERFDLQDESIEEEAGRKVYKCAVARKRLVPDGDTDWKLETETQSYRMSLVRICREWRIAKVD